jgi:fatty acid desaturase
MFEWGIALQGWESEHDRAATHAEKSAVTRALVGKIGRQAGKDYLIFPALSLRRWRRTLTANTVANLLRNVWAYVVICCGHFADGTQKFTPATLKDETKPEWYLRQMLGTANFHAGPVLAFLSGNLCYQIEHHLFPDLPSNRYAQIADQVRSVCARFAIPYTTGPLARQYLRTLRTIFTLALPDRPDGAKVDENYPDSPGCARLDWKENRPNSMRTDTTNERLRRCVGERPCLPCRYLSEPERSVLA